MPRAKPTRNPWMLHLASYKASHPKESLKTCMQKASKTYYRGENCEPNPQEIQYAIDQETGLTRESAKAHLRQECRWRAAPYLKMVDKNSKERIVYELDGKYRWFDGYKFITVSRDGLNSYFPNTSPP